MKCQPVWIDEGLDGKLVAFYYASETKMAWEYWRAKKPKERNITGEYNDSTAT